MAEFEAWPKIPRLNKPYVVTEKLDGTNAAVVIEDTTPPLAGGVPAGEAGLYEAGKRVYAADGRVYNVFAQSRKRIITPMQDNFGFAAWVWLNAETLVEVLGEGRHFGEWWGAGIQRTYGQLGKTFSLFNVKRWGFLAEPESPGVETAYGKLSVVPMLGMAENQGVVNTLVDMLRREGSVAAPGFMRPEGVVAFHTGSQQLYKAFCENDDVPKGEAE